MSEASFENLISAYLDNELSAEERTRAERLLADDPNAAKLLESLRDQKSRLHQLPRYKLDNGFADRLLGSAAFEKAVGENAAFENAVAVPSAELGRSVKWKAAAAAIGALAAMILVTLVVDPSWMTGREMATALKSKAVDSDKASNEEFAIDEASAKDTPEVDRMKAGGPGLDDLEPSEAIAFEQDGLDVDSDQAQDLKSSGVMEAPLKRKAFQKQSIAKKQNTAQKPGAARYKNKNRTGVPELAKSESAKRSAPATPAREQIGGDDSFKMGFADSKLAESAPANEQMGMGTSQLLADRSRTAVGGEQILEIVLPGTGIAGTYGISGFQRALRNNGIAFESSQSGFEGQSVFDEESDSQMQPNSANQMEFEKSNFKKGAEHKSQLIQNQAIRLVAKPENMKGLLTELAANRAQISSYGIAGDERNGRLDVAREMRKQASIQSIQSGLQQKLGQSGAADASVPATRMSKGKPESAGGRAGFGGVGRAGGLARAEEASVRDKQVDRQIEAVLGLDQQAQSQLPRRYFLLIRVANPANQHPVAPVPSKSSR